MKTLMKHNSLFAIILVLGFAAAAPSRADGMDYSDMDLPADKRIKLLTYDTNDIYTLNTRIGYQTNIEFSPREEIDTISVGDRSFWQIIPSGNRLFIRPMQEDVATNMTVITNRRSYQFDLKSGSEKDKSVVYVVRFVYPDEGRRMQPSMIEDPFLAVMAAPAAPVYAQPVAPAPAPVYIAPPPPVSLKPITSPAAPTAPQRNYLYTFSGPETDAPYEVFDDGRATYFRYLDDTHPAPVIAAIGRNGVEEPLAVHRQGRYFVVENVVPEMVMGNGETSVHVYNELMSPAP